jgi:phospholipid transport system substrate-binding protein
LRSIGKVFFLLLSMFLFTQSLVANEQQELKKHFLSKIDEVILIVEDKKLSKNDRNANIVKALTPMFDFELMAKLSLGNRWKELSSTDKKRFVKLYVQRMKQSYSSKIDAYKDEKVEVKRLEQKKPDRIALITDLISKQDKLEIVYKFHKPKTPIETKDNWLVYDVEIIGVSILKTDIAQFREFLQTKTITALMDALSKQS